jgi:quinol monooxygenase YgiN
LFVIYATALVRPEKVELYENTFRELRKIVLEREPGVSFYELCPDPSVPYKYRLFEAYADAEVQTEHLNTDYYKAAAAVLMTCFQGDHMEEIARRGLTVPEEIYPLVTSINIEVMQPIAP